MRNLYLSLTLYFSFLVLAFSSPMDEDKLYPTRQTILKECKDTTKSGLSPQQSQTISKSFNLYLNGKIDKAHFFAAIDSLVSTKKILGRHAAKIKELINHQTKPNFETATKTQPGHLDMKLAFKMISKQNKAIFERGIKTLGGIIIRAEDLAIKESVDNSLKYNLDEVVPLGHGMQRCLFQMKDQDTIAGALDLIHGGCENVAILNFANGNAPGGGYLKGANAQEEDLCRRTTLYPALDNLRKKGQYPIQNNELIFTPSVKILRESHRNDFKLMDNPVSVHVITQAAYNQRRGKPVISPDEFMKGTLDKIRLQLRVAKQKGCEGLVLGAFGCGAFCNDPEVVSNLYFQVFKEPEFTSQFRFVRFSIPGGNNLIVFQKNLMLPFES